VRLPSVGLFTYSTLPRGSVVHTACLADALHDAGWDVSVYALDKDGRGFFRPLRARFHPIAASPAPPSTAELVRVRARELSDYAARHALEHDVFHAEDCLTANGLLEARARSMRRPMRIVRTIHHLERFSDPYLAACQERSILAADACFAVSEAAARDTQRAFGFRAMRVSNGVDVARFSRPDNSRIETWRHKADVTPGPVLLAVGGVEDRKNTLGVLRAFVRIRRTYAHAKLWILGGATVLDHGAYRVAFDAELASLPVDVRSAVSELGVVDDADVPAILHVAHVLVFPSLHEGFGLAALEALAAGLPLVASNQPPMTEFVDPSCAVLVDPQNDDSIADGVMQALAEAPSRRAAGLRVAEAHSWARVATLHANHYLGLLRDASGKGRDRHDEVVSHA